MAMAMNPDADFEATLTEGANHWIESLSPEDLAALGHSLRPIDPTLMKVGDVSQGKRLWYQGREPYFDVVFETEDDIITWFQFTLRGKVVFWNGREKRLQTGETEELDTPPMLAYYAATKTIRDGANLDRRFVELAIAVLKARDGDSLCQRMAKILTTALG